MTDTTSGATNPSTARTTAFADEAVLELLDDRQRRYLLRGLRHVDGDRTLAELAREVAAWETNRSVADVSDATVERVHASLYHNHVPLLADAGLVAYDQEAGAVALTEDAPDVGLLPRGDDGTSRRPSHST